MYVCMYVAIEIEMERIWGCDEHGKSTGNVCMYVCERIFSFFLTSNKNCPSTHAFVCGGSKFGCVYICMYVCMYMNLE